MATDFDVVLLGGILMDGTGSPARTADVGLKGDRVAEIGDLRRASARERVDVRGLVVCPGFVDIHSHSDLSILAHPDASSRIGQGVTTEVVGNCGHSAAPVGESRRDEFLAWNRSAPAATDFRWSRMSEYLARVEEAEPATNQAALVGHGNVRLAVLGFERRAPDASELAAMARLVKEAMDDGAVGLSTGLIYAPGVYADREEIIALARVAAAEGGIYATHMRNEADGLVDAVDEAIDIGRRAGIPLEISHLKAASAAMHGRLPAVIERIEGERAAGGTVGADFYPYSASSTALSALLPPWTLEGGVSELLERLASVDVRQRIAYEIRQGIPGWPNPVGAAGKSGWHHIMIAHAKDEADRGVQGMRVDEIARLWGVPEIDAVATLLRRSHGAVSVVRFAMAPSDVAAAAATPWIAVGSDGSAISPAVAGAQLVHPRAYGSAARFLQDFGTKVGWEEAVRRMSRLPAQRVGLPGRGTLHEGAYADVVVMDTGRVADTATYDRPHSLPTGIVHVYVNGKAALRDGQLTDTRTGRVLRRASA